MCKWTEKCPNKEGMYWFYGYRFGKDNLNEKPELCLVEVWKIANGLAHVARGNFMYQEEGAIGLFTPADHPPLPEDLLKILLLGVEDDSD